MSVPPPPAWSVPPPRGPAPLDQPQYDATIGQAASRFWRKFAVFSGRASRSEYWWWQLVAFGISLVLQVIGYAIFGFSTFGGTGESFPDLRTLFLPLVPSLVWSVVALVPSIALVVRRLHDINRSGWWYLLYLPLVVGYVPLLLGLRSFDPERLAAGGGSGLAVGPLVAAGVLLFVGWVGSIVLLVFTVLGPDPRGARFDRRG